MQVVHFVRKSFNRQIYSNTRDTRKYLLRNMRLVNMRRGNDIIQEVGLAHCATYRHCACKRSQSKFLGIGLFNFFFVLVFTVKNGNIIEKVYTLIKKPSLDAIKRL